MKQRITLHYITLYYIILHYITIYNIILDWIAYIAYKERSNKQTNTHTHKSIRGRVRCSIPFCCKCAKGEEQLDTSVCARVFEDVCSLEGLGFLETTGARLSAWPGRGRLSATQEDRCGGMSPGGPRGAGRRDRWADAAPGPNACTTSALRTGRQALSLPSKGMRHKRCRKDDNASRGSSRPARRARESFGPRGMSGLKRHPG